MSEVLFIDATLNEVLWKDIPAWSQSGIQSIFASTTKGRIIGEMHDPFKGQKYRFYGEWKPDRKGDGEVFSFYSYDIIEDRSKNGIIDYIERYVPGFGPARAKLIWE